ncbi:aminomethyltransferase family protein [Pseudemcibacter aquimaris]|uniref:aminomethyltransferase family protein n=1 Tax=Pseudemcibacter aquimaris TaxID=2857064 RepID=UPI002013B217|nr:aminomethyltransferase family protein [Pseudemcibacter aquimaris]MCC3862116.1 aminomethyltransferase family protein [Pseudemcibacter aquimaris]WDU58869.1 aminomethyltransferase family protein [Pseudemcibacter aquimaris]
MSEMHDFKEVLKPTPFHDRIEKLNLMNSWAPWGGYKVSRVLDKLAAEYFAVRSGCSVFDMTPMEKYRIKGPDALEFLNRLVTRDVSNLKPGRVTYVVWCNDAGRVLDDGTIFHLGDDGFRLCAAHHQLDWLLLSSIGFDVTIEEETHDVAALSVQGPTSYSVLTEAGIDGLSDLKPFGILNTKLGGKDVMISRTGFTGDLGYEVWVDPSDALMLWDAIFGVKERGLYDVRAMGLDALEMVRIEAGFLLPGDDFVTAETAVRSGRDRSPFELGLGWAVSFDKPYFTGRKALEKERVTPIKRRLVKLSIEGNKPPTDSFLYDGKNGNRIGSIRKTVWSPIMKQNFAMADIEYQNGRVPNEIWAEIYYQKELEWKANWAKCEISEKPFWNPPRRNQTPPGAF